MLTTLFRVSLVLLISVSYVSERITAGE